MEEKYTFELIIEADRDDLGSDFQESHEDNWAKEIPTREELKDSIKSEVQSWLWALDFGVTIDEVAEEDELALAKSLGILEEE